MLDTIAALERGAAHPHDWGQIAEWYLAAAAEDPGDHRLLANAANARWLSGDAPAALALYKRAIQMAPDCPVVFRGLGNALVDLGLFEAAERAYRRSLVLCADDETRWNLSQLLIGMARYQEGYGLAESRWNLKHVVPWRTGQIQSVAEAIAPEQRLLVWSEQGFGDIFQHLRWLFPLLRRRGPGAAALHLEVEESLVSFMRAVFRDGSPQPVVVAKPPQRAAAWDGPHVSLLSLPRLLGFGPIEEAAAPLSAPDWRGPASAGPRRPRVGLVWRAGRKLEDPHAAREYWLRSLDQQALGRLIEGLVGLGCDCVALQFGVDRDLAEPWSGAFATQLPAAADFGETARLVAGLDLVISVDTAMAHLAGCLQRPVWVLLPFSAAPRWGRQTSTSCWYPSMRLFRQEKPWDWNDPIQELLQAWARWHGPGPAPLRSGEALQG